MVPKKIESAKRNGEIIFDIVQKWLAEVDDVSAKAEKFLEDEGKAKKRYLKGQCINLGQCYRFSKEAKKYTLAISDQLQESEKLVIVSCPPPPFGIISSSEAFNSGTVKSRDSLKKAVVKALIDDKNKLFSKIAGPIVENSDINQFARDVIVSCGRLPLAIVTIARALKGKNKHVWRNTGQQLKMSTPSSIPELERYVFSSLELSFNYLEKEAKSLFLFCSLFPEDYKIPVEDLVKYWTGLRWFGYTYEAIEVVRNGVHAIVNTITSSFLLIEENEKYVKMHDVISDFAIAIAPRYNHKFMVNARIGLKEWPQKDTYEDFTCISLMANYIRELLNGLEYPNLQALSLQENELLIPALNLKEIFEKKEVEDEELDHTITSPYLENLTDIEISYCYDLENLFTPSIAKLLVKLKSLRLWECSRIQEIITNEIGEREKSSKSIVFPSLENLILHDLENLSCFSSGPYTSEFPKLEILEIGNCEKMKTFGSGKQVTPKLKEVLLSKEALGRGTGHWNGNLNTTLQEFFNEQANKA
ncbi:probable disease resistance protein At4g27220 [Mangifera indica]|uniref:probable disease resistance protein At4g27220 n=1 Tax=Mangifera indica TaxID=29780 RepID=UPI001CFC2AC9|nr:probable disease resistance protein At4g27220 [Mangifera indica]